MLARLVVPDLGEVDPELALSVFFDNGMAGEFTELALRTAVRDRPKLVAEFGVDDLGVAVNLSSAQLRLGAELLDAVDAALLHADFDPSLLTFEILEDVAAPRKSLITDVVDALRLRGIRISLDDFGTGRSSLEHLLDLEVDEFKLDRRFTASMETDRRAKLAIDALVSFGRSADLRVVVEGVEDEATLQRLQQLGVDWVQGWVFGRPISLGGNRAGSKTDIDLVEDPALDQLLAAMEHRQRSIDTPTRAEAVGFLAQIAAFADYGPLTARVARVRSWLLEIADESHGASDHELAARRLLSDGRPSLAALEFSRSANTAAAAESMLAAQHAVTEGCRLIAAAPVMDESVFRAIGNLARMYGSAGARLVTADLLDMLVASDTPSTSEVRWVCRFESVEHVLEVLEEGGGDEGDLVACNRRLDAMRNLHESLGEHPVCDYFPIGGLEVRALLLNDGIVQARRVFDSQPAPRTREGIAFWLVAEFELAFALGDVQRGYETSRRALAQFDLGGVYEVEKRHVRLRQAQVMSKAGHYAEAFHAQNEVLSADQRSLDELTARVQARALDFDLATFLRDQIGRLTTIGARA